MPTLLVVDDEPSIPYTVAEALESPHLTVIEAATGRQGIEAFKARRPDVVLLDVRLPDMCGLDAFLQMRTIDTRLPVVIMTAFTTTETAIEAMSRGAFEYLVKPVDLSRLQDVVERAIDASRAVRVPTLLPDESSRTGDADQIVGTSAAMQEVYKAIGRMASHDSAVLILGESGTGKELAARAIYHHSRGKDRPFLAINCAAIPETLLESELFGHEQSAFTGADQRRIGKFEQCKGGTIFLDEIGDMSPGTQAKILRFLQEQRFERVGGNTTVTTDVRVIAATNQNLDQLIAEDRFQADLYYRFDGSTITLPPLCDRTEDIPQLADHFLRRANCELGRTVQSIAHDAMAWLTKHPWPGNVRELQNAITYATLHATADVITAGCLPESCGSRRHGADATRGPPFDLADITRELLAGEHGNLYRRLSLLCDGVILAEVMADCGGNLPKAAERLGIGRVTLRDKLRKLGMRG